MRLGERALLTHIDERQLGLAEEQPLQLARSNLTHGHLRMARNVTRQKRADTSHPVALAAMRCRTRAIIEKLHSPPRFPG